MMEYLLKYVIYYSMIKIVIKVALILVIRDVCFEYKQEDQILRHLKLKKNSKDGFN